MGVPGLWNLLEPARRPVDLEQLSGKIVAIDMNIWLHQAVKSRAASGGPSKYLAVLFRRLCKLLYFGIRPVFVFDGEVPALKKSTIAARRRLRGQLGEKADRAQQRMLRRLLRRVAESATATVASKSNDDSHGTTQTKDLEQAKSELLQRLVDLPEVQKAKEDAQLFVAPTGELRSESGNTGLLHESAGLEFDELARDYLDSVSLYAPSNNTTEPLDLHSPSFCALPALAQLRVIQLAREQLECGFRASCQQQLTFEEDTEVFSANQVHRLLLRRRLSERHEELSVQIAKEEASHQLAQLDSSHLLDVFRTYLKTDGEESGTVTSALRIQSRDAGHAILIKKPSPRNQFVVNRLLEKGDPDSQDKAADGKYLPDVSLETDDSEAEEQSIDRIPSVDPTVAYEQKLAPTSSRAVALTPSEICFGQYSSDISSESTSSQEKLHPYRLQTTCTPLIESARFVSCSDQFADDVSKTVNEAVSLSETPVQHTAPPDAVISSPDTLNDTSHGNQKGELSSEEEDGVERDFIEVPESNIVSQPSEDASDEQTTSNDEENQPSITDRDNFAGFSLAHEWIEDTDEFRLDDDVLREQADRLARQARTTTTRCIDEAQQLLDLFGVPILVGPEEAEAQCAALQRSSHVDLVATDDSDVWPFGARVVCRHLFGGSTSKGSDKTLTKNENFLRCPSLYLLEDVHKLIGLSVPNFLRLAMLCGSDYTPGVQNVGPVTAVEIISEFDSPQDALSSAWRSWLNGSDASDDLIAQVIEPLRRFVAWWRVASESEKPSAFITSPLRRKWINLSLPPGFPDSRIVEAYLRPKVTPHTESFSWRVPDVESLAKYMQDLLGWNLDQTKSTLRAVLSRQQEQNFCSSSPTTRITNYFPRATHSVQIEKGSQEKPDRAASPSKRTRAAISRLLFKDAAINKGTTSNVNSSISECTLTGELQQLPCRKRSIRKRPAPHDIESRINKTVRQRSTARKRSGRRVVDQVALSEDEGDGVS